MEVNVAHIGKKVELEYEGRTIEFDIRLLQIGDAVPVNFNFRVTANQIEKIDESGLVKVDEEATTYSTHTDCTSLRLLPFDCCETEDLIKIFTELLITS